MVLTESPTWNDGGEIRERILTESGRTAEDREIYLAQLRQRIKKYERRYEMTSAEMIEALHSGKLRETRDIGLWAWTWETLRSLEEGTRTTGTP